MRAERTVLWRRLDAPGADACRISAGPDDLVLEGVAVWRENGENARMAYCVTCDRDGGSRAALVEGWVGGRDLRFEIARGPEGWTVDGAATDAPPDALDVDLGFTPATNTVALRRMGLAVGAAGGGVAAWLDPRDWRLKPLRQRYAREAEDVYRYDSPDNGYTARLRVDEHGVVALYPELWRLEG
ncbi:putative glycolipid-binding domain-containing protein [Rubrimonas cliftonensis]|uniref:Glycolipid-binding n=1 Tax=Rubrimonas cliftonensis TaxID=89524 RepID=A0A1H3WQB7_9RHOB|nr:putative glycolipid-binding domain-containing protein [Rubrimonas cliftonensis]SDZ88582.1 hypothetical protein SAMN05444370_10240 [Rubrimonas cliftonensis]